MNVFFVIILVALLSEFILELAINVLNMHALERNPPKELERVYEPDEYRKAQDYNQVSTRMEIITGAFGLFWLLGFWFTGGFNLLDNMIRELELAPPFAGVIYLGCITIGYSLLMLPWSIYSIFAIEGKYGFNTTTVRTFVSDRVKGLFLTILIGGPVLLIIISIFEYGGTMAWLYCWISVTLISISMMFVAPTWIMPLFNKFTPMESGELKESIVSYSNSVDFHVKDIFVIDGSKRSTKANAFFTGFGRNKRIGLFDTLVENHPIKEIVAVVAHEIGHYKKKHIQKRALISIINTGLMFYLLSIFLDNQLLFDAFFMEEESVYVALLLFGLVYTPVNVTLSLIGNWISRKDEQECDLWAVDTGADGDAMLAALIRLAANNLSNLTPHPLMVFVHFDHPTLLQRVNAIHEKMKIYEQSRDS
ncbi:MAG: M48 family metallopeptidase [Chloroflexota bacterium]|nr:M48 family metallopeptidase [Chloroflexota bacterium]